MPQVDLGYCSRSLFVHSKPIQPNLLEIQTNPAETPLVDMYSVNFSIVAAHRRTTSNIGVYSRLDGKNVLETYCYIEAKTIISPQCPLRALYL
jgi:hypothetical protein